jgi:hypothetical protein
MNNIKKRMEKLVLKRFGSLEELKQFMRNTLNIKVNSLIFSESERIPELDFMIDGEYRSASGTYDIEFTIFYLFDNDNNILITEI